MSFATDDEIRIAHDILLKEKKPFDNPRVEIIKKDGSDGSDNTELRDENVLYIRNSNRFGEKIARPLRFLCMEDNHLLVGNEDVYSVKPVILTYEDPLHRVNIKACGWVGKKGANEQKIYIESYYPSFEKKNVKTRGGREIHLMVSYIKALKEQ